MATVLTTAITGAIMNVIASLEGVGQLQIVVLDRGGNDPSMFWNAASKRLCQKTGENWCDQDVIGVLTDTTNPLGWSKLITYQGRTSGQTKKVCAILPPEPLVSPYMAATGLSAGGYGGAGALPTSADTYTWLLLQAAANCIPERDTAFADRRADAFATIATTLINGDPAATLPNGVGPARLFQTFRNYNVNRWAANMAERYEFDVWKAQTVTAGPNIVGCRMIAVPNSELAMDQIQRDPAVYPGDSCAANSTQGARVTDANLHAWMYQSPIGAPPAVWQPFQGFADYNTATKWTWDTAGDLARQYAQ